MIFFSFQNLYIFSACTLCVQVKIIYKKEKRVSIRLQHYSQLSATCKYTLFLQGFFLLFLFAKKNMGKNESYQMKC